jgi:hypothetical protein
VDRIGPTIAIAVVVVLVFLAMWWGWRRRGRRDNGLRPINAVPADLGVELAAAKVFYVATTKHDVPIERLAIRGLGFRGRATVAVSAAGAVLSIAGENPVFIPADRIDTVDQATWAIDRVVEPEGLVRIAWRISNANGAEAGTNQAGSSQTSSDKASTDLASTDQVTTAETLVDSYLRVIDPDERKPLVDALRTISVHPIESEV